MIELKGDIFKTECDIICITTNGFVKTNGDAVMGNGVANQLKKYIPDAEERLGRILRRLGNVVWRIGDINGIPVLSFPVKPYAIDYDPSCVVKHIVNKFKKGDKVPGWAAKADIEIIKNSAYMLRDYVEEHYPNATRILLPRPGAGAGELPWEETKEVLSKILDDRYVAIAI